MLGHDFNVLPHHRMGATQIPTTCWYIRSILGPGVDVTVREDKLFSFVTRHGVVLLEVLPETARGLIHSSCRALRHQAT
jgi:hypothetical protein